MSSLISCSNNIKETYHNIDNDENLTDVREAVIWNFKVFFNFINIIFVLAWKCENNFKTPEMLCRLLSKSVRKAKEWVTNYEKWTQIRY